MSMIGKTLGTFTLEAQIGKGAWERSTKPRTRNQEAMWHSMSCTLKSGGHDYTLTRKGIVDVICPPGATN